MERHAKHTGAGAPRNGRRVVGGKIIHHDGRQTQLPGCRHNSADVGRLVSGRNHHCRFRHQVCHVPIDQISHRYLKNLLQAIVDTTIALFEKVTMPA